MSEPYGMTSLNLTSLEVLAPNIATWDRGFNIGIWGRDTNRCQAQTGHKHLASLVSVVKNLPAMQETWVRFLGQEDPLEKEMPTHSSILAWQIPWAEEPGGL
ncbi:unnamed protein product [Rangifer tarandus platyrhynchus]|uniref:Uncharacterized protein n=2 Tax=Rangifer tarandus platyrhynchus TaxID=3082113 RepID=A0AC59ZYS1_RANTA|nr:unnamed protein product [Rangifer tarandus platyrhynchus]